MNNQYHIIRKGSFWAIARDLEDGSRKVAHVGKPTYIQKIWNERYAKK